MLNSFILPENCFDLSMNTKATPEPGAGAAGEESRAGAEAQELSNPIIKIRYKQDFFIKPPNNFYTVYGF
jgi:hypothetical protein